MLLFKQFFFLQIQLTSEIWEFFNSTNFRQQVYLYYKLLLLTCFLFIFKCLRAEPQSLKMNLMKYLYSKLYLFSWQQHLLFSYEFKTNVTVQKQRKPWIQTGHNLEMNELTQDDSTFEGSQFEMVVSSLCDMWTTLLVLSPFNDESRFVGFLLFCCRRCRCPTDLCSGSWSRCSSSLQLHSVTRARGKSQLHTVRGQMNHRRVNREIRRENKHRIKKKLWMIWRKLSSIFTVWKKKEKRNIKAGKY